MAGDGMRTDSVIGSLRVVPRRPGHVHGDGDDGTTTRAGKAAAMAGGINLTLPVRSYRRHRQARTRLIVACVALAVVLALAARWAWRMYGL
jgi:hypothetical protein